MTYKTRKDLNVLDIRIFFAYLIILLIVFSFAVLFTNISSQTSNNTLITSLTTQSSTQGAIKQPSKTKIAIPFTGFIQNNGQERDSSIKFYYISSGSAIGFGDSIIYFSKFTSIPGSENSYTSFNLTFKGSNKVQPTGVNQMASKSNYFIGQKHYTNVNGYTEIWYYNLYPNIDLRYYMSQNGLKYEFIVRPKGNPNNIITDVTSNIQIKQQSNGIALYTNTGTKSSNTPLMVDSHLTAYTTNGKIVTAAFNHINNNLHNYGFTLGSYNTKVTLIIDPIWLGFSTFIGGDRAYGYAIATDSIGNTYVTGSTFSNSFPTVNAYNNTYGGLGDVFVLELNATGNGLIYATFVGGSNADQGNGIAVDSNGNAYVTGSTSSTNFPMVNAYNSNFGGVLDAFVLKLSATGNSLIYSTYIGGSLDDSGNGIALDSNGNAYVTGDSYSTNFPMVNAYNSTYGGSDDVIFFELSPSGNSILFSTYIGGSSSDSGNAISLDSSGGIYITGTTWSSNFPMLNAYNNTYGGNRDAFVCKFTTFKTISLSLAFSTYVGGSSQDDGYSISVDSSGNSYVTGDTYSSNFPTSHAYNSTYGGAQDAFVFKLNSAGNSLVYSTFIGGNNADQGNGIAVYSTGMVYITGVTSSSNFPTLHAYNSTFGGAQDAFVVKLNSTGNGLVYSTFIGGNIYVNCKAIALDSNGNAYITGYTSSSNFPTKNGYQNTFSGTSDGFVVKFSNVTDDTPPSIKLSSSITSILMNSQKTKTVGLIISDSISGVAQSLYHWDGSSNSTIPTSQAVPTPTTDGSHVLHVYAKDVAGNWNSATFKFTVDNSQPTDTYLGIKNLDTYSGKINITVVPKDNLDSISKVEFLVNNQSIYSANIAPYTWIWDTTTTGNGAYTITIITTDAVGNAQISTFQITVNNKAPLSIDPLSILGILFSIAIPVAGFTYWKSFNFRNRRIIKMYMNDLSIEDIAKVTGKTQRRVEEILRKAKKKD